MGSAAYLKQVEQEMSELWCFLIAASVQARGPWVLKPSPLLHLCLGLRSWDCALLPESKQTSDDRRSKKAVNAFNRVLQAVNCISCCKTWLLVLWHAANAFTPSGCQLYEALHNLCMQIHGSCCIYLVPPCLATGVQYHHATIAAH